MYVEETYLYLFPHPKGDEFLFLGGRVKGKITVSSMLTRWECAALQCLSLRLQRDGGTDCAHGEFEDADECGE